MNEAGLMEVRTAYESKRIKIIQEINEISGPLNFNEGTAPYLEEDYQKLLTQLKSLSDVEKIEDIFQREGQQGLLDWINNPV